MDPSKSPQSLQSSTTTAQPDLILYGDYGSQPTRAVFCFLTINKIPFTYKEVSILHRDHLKPEYRKIHPNAKIPAITDTLNNINLFESHAILKYLHLTRATPDHWYPKDPALRAKVDEYLDWHHSNLRKGAEGVFLTSYFLPLTQKQVPHDEVINSMNYLKASLQTIETYWLKNPNKKYLITDEVTLADLSAACELAQLLPLESQTLREYPKVMAWMSRMCSIPEVKDLHSKILPVIKRVYKDNTEYRAKI
ncbi:glutathione s-transferase domain-containing protein [Stylonychia lemnae]|uniref:Glutathione s-transferase domain-containing protein n=1 Tax=Stylonychia lemnae TaxID=5949 RepID=A0A077ZQT0_STYLE|nr:glutathione s-transferase domain-containing protein [Stylonychia lemnae]|eukprot:CDW72288.1 glutathione s-transferase domain-containing protein [Stylonychia lemnae]